MIIEAGDLFLQLDTGNNKPGAVLERLTGDMWRVYRINGKQVPWPVKIGTLPPGKYRAVKPKS